MNLESKSPSKAFKTYSLILLEIEELQKGGNQVLLLNLWICFPFGTFVWWGLSCLVVGFKFLFTQLHVLKINRTQRQRDAHKFQENKRTRNNVSSCMLGKKPKCKRRNVFLALIINKRWKHAKQFEWQIFVVLTTNTLVFNHSFKKGHSHFSWAQKSRRLIKC
jgi:hypothetical protein